jgi:hypothetical protein
MLWHGHLSDHARREIGRETTALVDVADDVTASLSVIVARNKENDKQRRCCVKKAGALAEDGAGVARWHGMS